MGLISQVREKEPEGILSEKQGPWCCSDAWARSVQFSSVQFCRSVVSDSLRPHELQHTSLLHFFLRLASAWVAECVCVG